MHTFQRDQQVSFSLSNHAHGNSQAVCPLIEHFMVSAKIIYLRHWVSFQPLPMYTAINGFNYREMSLLCRVTINAKLPHRGPGTRRGWAKHTRYATLLLPEKVNETDRVPFSSLSPSPCLSFSRNDRLIGDLFRGINHAIIHRVRARGGGGKCGDR